jgi:glycosyltransferase involved in cell wall biosynthesis
VDVSEPAVPRVSVILPTRNRSALLPRTLESLRGQTLAANEFEVIVVDNGSTDDTRAIVERLSGGQANLRYVFEANPGLHNARHAGIEAARSELLLFGDDDIRAFPTWVEAVLRCFEDPKVGLVGGRCLPDMETTPPAWFDSLWTAVEGGRVLGDYSLVDLGDRPHDTAPHLVYGCNYAVRKTLVLQLGGFHPDSLPEDLWRLRGDGETGLSMKIAAAGYRVRYEPAASVHHLVSPDRLTAKYLYRRAFAQGISDSYSAARYGRPVLRHFLAGGLRAMRAALRPGVAQAREVLRAQTQGYLDGLRFHRGQLRADPTLLQWVQRTDYLDHGTR